MGAVKTERALRAASIGANPGSVGDMLALIPQRVRERLPSRELAELADAIWQVCEATKAIAARDALDEGAIWDARRQRLVELAA